MPDVSDLLVDNALQVHKHGTQLVAIADYGTTVPTSFFGSDGLPVDLPTGHMVMGYITTDGVVKSRSVSNTDTQMVQDLDPVRSDTDSDVLTFKLTFGEISAWTMALYNGQLVADWAATNSNGWAFDRGAVSELPYYRFWFYSEDGTGNNRVARVEYAYRAKITDFGDSTLNRTDAEGVQLTFTCYKDPAVGKTTHSAASPFVVS